MPKHKGSSKFSQALLNLGRTVLPYSLRHSLINVTKKILEAEIGILPVNILNELTPKIYARPGVKPPITTVGYPQVLHIFLTTACNLHCFICDREEYTPQLLEFENIYKLENAIYYANTIDLTGWGEPFTYPRFQDVLNYITSTNNKGEIINLATNGTKLNSDYAKMLNGRIKFITISLNAATSETYNRDMKHGNFDRTMKAVSEFLAELSEKDRSKINFHFVAHTKNFREIPLFVQLASSLGVQNVSIGNYLINSTDRFPYTLLQVKKEYDQIIEQSLKIARNEGITLQARTFKHDYTPPVTQCIFPYTDTFILPNGDMGPCCYSGNYYLGNAYKTSFEQVWFGKEYRKLREKRFLPACQNCTPYHAFNSIASHCTGDFRVSKNFNENELLKATSSDD